jgi:hypothetical protein
MFIVLLRATSATGSYKDQVPYYMRRNEFSTKRGKGWDPGKKIKQVERDRGHWLRKILVAPVSWGLSASE